MRSDSRVIAYIPARSGSERIPNKNVKLLGGKPLLAHTVRLAVRSGLFSRVVIITDSEEYADIAVAHGADFPGLRPKWTAFSSSPDISWVRWVDLVYSDDSHSAFCILRPTSPFRSNQGLERALKTFFESSGTDSLRGVEEAKVHPGKMWWVDGSRIKPFLTEKLEGVPWHSSQTKVLPKAYQQNGSLEIAWRRVITETNSISGNTIIPFTWEGYEGLDINSPDDWELCESLLKARKVKLPE